MPAKKKQGLTTPTLAELQLVQEAVRTSFLRPGGIRANVVGLGVGIKWTNGEPTGKPALIVLVTHKVPKAQLREEDIVPATLETVPTDVMAIGYPIAGGGVFADARVQTLAERVRPVQGGYSVGHKDVTAGTIATSVYDMLPEASVNPPAAGIGIPPRYYLLSNNHVLANSNHARIGDPILQPGPYDGGMEPQDRIATLARFVPIMLDPPTPRDQHQNLVDAAVATGRFEDLDRSIYWSGPVQGWRPRDRVEVGLVVKKTGRTTHFTLGRVTAIQATVDVNFGGSLVARFHDQIILTNMSAGGDSGSLITTLDNVAVGLLFAGSPLATIANQIEHVRTLLHVEVAEQVL